LKVFEAVKNNHPYLVVSDIKMPGMDGFELLRKIRSISPDAGGIVPVIVMTAFVTHAGRSRILNAGFQGCLPKPFAQTSFWRRFWLCSMIS